MEPQTNTPTKATTMDVVAPPAQAESAPSNQPQPVPQSEIERKPEQVTAPEPTKPAALKDHNSSVTLAVISTVIIVLGLSALATFAYLQSK